MIKLYIHKQEEYTKKKRDYDNKIETSILDF